MNGNVVIAVCICFHSSVLYSMWYQSPGYIFSDKHLYQICFTFASSLGRNTIAKYFLLEYSFEKDANSAF